MRARLLALLWLVVPVHAAAAPLDGYEAYARKALADWKVPGAAIAVVKDGRVVAVTGIGVREAGKPEKVDEHTVFAIASLSKGITAASVALLVDEGKLRWDDRVIEHLPGFRVADPYVTRELTLRDLLAHRSGLTPDADWLWGLGYRPDEILARLRYATQGSSLRAAFSYQNVLYLVLGEVVAARAGMSWQRFTRERLLGPLGMNETRLTLAELAGASNVARPHSDRSGAMVPLPAHEDGDPVAPAASASSTAADLARWMRFQLGDPGVGGALVRPETREEMQAPQMLDPLGPSGRKLYPGARFRAYAFGWVVQDHRGRTVVWNTGGLSGMTCSLALVPEEKLGVAVLTNGPRIALPEALVFRALDAYLGAPPRDWSGLRLADSLARRAQAEPARPAAAPAVLPLDRYAGTYGQDLLGDVVVVATGARLSLRFGRALAGEAEPWGRDSFRIRWANPEYGVDVVVFQLDASGLPARLVVDGLGAFDRRP